MMSLIVFATILSLGWAIVLTQALLHRNALKTAVDRRKLFLSLTFAGISIGLLLLWSKLRWMIHPLNFNAHWGLCCLGLVGFFTSLSSAIIVPKISTLMRVASTIYAPLMMGVFALIILLSIPVS
jgi:hypothetical protein